MKEMKHFLVCLGGILILVAVFRLFGEMSPDAGDISSNGNPIVLFWIPVYSLLILICITIFRLIKKTTKNTKSNKLKKILYLSILSLIISISFNLFSIYTNLNSLQFHKHIASVHFNSIIFDVWNLITLIIFSCFLAIWSNFRCVKLKS